MYSLTKVWHPARFQSGTERAGYFEGWYFKAVDASGSDSRGLTRTARAGMWA